jgi:hypothetical protein
MGEVGSKTILYIEDNLADLQLIEGIFAFRRSVVSSRRARARSSRSP